MNIRLLIYVMLIVMIVTQAVVAQVKAQFLSYEDNEKLQLKPKTMRLYYQNNILVAVICALELFFVNIEQMSDWIIKIAVIGILVLGMFAETFLAVYSKKQLRQYKNIDIDSSTDSQAWMERIFDVPQKRIFKNYLYWCLQAILIDVVLCSAIYMWLHGHGS